MATNNDYRLFSAYAPVDGAIVGAMWIGSFLCFVGEFMVPMLGFLGIALGLASLYVLVYRERKFRDNVLGGVMSYGKAMLYSVQTLFHATLLLAAAQFVYFQFIDHGYLLNQYIATLSGPEYAKMVKDVYGVEAKQLIAILQNVTASLRPIEVALQFLTLNVVLSIFVSIPVGAIVRRVRG